MFRQRVVVRVVDELVRAQRRERRQADAEALVVGVLWAAWGVRVELLMLIVLAALYALAAGAVGELGALVLLAIATAAVLARPRSRRAVVELLRVMHVRRRWARATIDAGAAVGPFRCPGVRSVARVPAGDLLRVRVRRGGSVSALESRREELAASLRAREVRIGRDPADAARASVLVVRRDPFEAGGPRGWPDADASRRSLWDPVPLGIDELGRQVSVALPERNLLIGGEPGAGKSATLSLVLAAAALDPSVRLWLLDGKLVELAAWEPCAERIAGADVEHAIALLEDVQGEMEQRYRELLARGRRKIGADDGLALHVIACDELAFYLTAEDRKLRSRFAELLRDLVARGRAAGVIVIAATQKPAADVVPSALRDLFGFRLAMRCTTPQASDTILGQGWASQGYSAATIGPSQRGVGFLLAEDGLPVRLRGYYLDDPTLDQLAERACALRADAWLDSQTAETAA